jgi:hypothetical protein
MTVDLAFSGTATLTTDYTRSGTQIVIAAGNTSGSITVTAVQDALDEADETVIVDISVFTNGTESGTQQQTTTITDDDAPLTLNASPATIAFGAVPVAGTSILSVLVANVGTDPVSIRAITTSPAAFAVSDTAGVLEAGDVLFIPVTFLPAAAGTYSGLLELTCTEGTLQVPLAGNGTVAPVRMVVERQIAPSLPQATVVEVQVRLTNAAALSLLGFAIEFDASRFEFVELAADAGRMLKTADVSVSTGSSVTEVRVAAASLTGDTAVLAGDGVFATLRLRTTTTIGVAVVPLVVTEIAAMDTSIVDVEASAANGEIQIGAVSPTIDVDNDGLTNFRDVVFIYRRLMGLSTVKSDWTLPTGETEASINGRIDSLCQVGFDGFAPLDTDHDGHANFRDVVFIYRRLMGLSTVKSDWTLPVGETEASINGRIDCLRNL